MRTVGVVTTVAPGRLDNLTMVMEALRHQTNLITHVVIVYDGWGPLGLTAEGSAFYVTEACVPTWKRGDDQPRNIGARILHDTRYIDWVWFLDSDVVPAPTALSAFNAAQRTHDERAMLLGPYEWCAEGEGGTPFSLYNDPRWKAFREEPPEKVLHGPPPTIGYAAISGNLVWPLERFIELGGFWNEIRRGEDGELGVRAVKAGVGLAFVGAARAWHQWHPVDREDIARQTAHDYALIQKRHPDCVIE